MTEKPNCGDDHQGENYRIVLRRLHESLTPNAYLEIGTLDGGTLKLSDAPSIAIDPKFQVTTEVIGKKERCLLYQMKSDDFFASIDPQLLLESKIDLCFLDGMHHCEFLLRDFINAERCCSRQGVIVMHDCLPVEIPMTDRRQNGTPAVMLHRNGWWTGDVWKTALALKRYRPDLRILCLDASPTGLVIISGLDTNSKTLLSKYDEICSYMTALDIEDITVTGLFAKLDVRSTPQDTHELLRCLRL